METKAKDWIPEGKFTILSSRYMRFRSLDSTDDNAVKEAQEKENIEKGRYYSFDVLNNLFNLFVYPEMIRRAPTEEKRQEIEKSGFFMVKKWAVVFYSEDAPPTIYIDNEMGKREIVERPASAETDQGVYCSYYAVTNTGEIISSLKGDTDAKIAEWRTVYSEAIRQELEKKSKGEDEGDDEDRTRIFLDYSPSFPQEVRHRKFVPSFYVYRAGQVLAGPPIEGGLCSVKDALSPTTIRKYNLTERTSCLSSGKKLHKQDLANADQLWLGGGLAIRAPEEIRLSRRTTLALFNPLKQHEYHQKKGTLDIVLATGEKIRHYTQKTADWFFGLDVTDLEYVIKLAGLAQAVRNHIEANPKDDIQVFRDSDGLLNFRYAFTDDFYSHFLEKKKISNRQEGYKHTEKKELHKWLKENQNRMTLDVITEREGEHGPLYGVMPLPLYKYLPETDAVGRHGCGNFAINTSILADINEEASLSFDRRLFDQVRQELTKRKKQDKANWLRLQFSRYPDMPMKFYIALKTAYNRELAKMGKRLRNGKPGEPYAPLTLEMQRLDIMLGDSKTRSFKARVFETIKARRGHTGITEVAHFGMVNDTLDYLVDIAGALGWVRGEKALSKNKTSVIFFLNLKHFDYQYAQNLKEIEKQ